MYHTIRPAERRPRDDAAHSSSSLVFPTVIRPAFRAAQGALAHVARHAVLVTAIYTILCSFLVRSPGAAAAMLSGDDGDGHSHSSRCFLNLAISLSNSRHHSSARPLLPSRYLLASTRAATIARWRAHSGQAEGSGCFCTKGCGGVTMSPAPCLSQLSTCPGWLPRLLQ